MTQKRKLTKYEENNYPKEKRKNSIKQSEKRFVVQKKYNAYLSHLSIMDYERVGLWICAFRGVQKEK